MNEELKLLSDIRVMLLQRRATNIRDQVDLAESDEDLISIELEDGSEHRMLTWECALRHAVEEMRRNSEFIDRALQS